MNDVKLTGDGAGAEHPARPRMSAWLARGWLVAAFVALAFATFVWVYSNRLPRFASYDLWWKRGFVGDEHHDRTIGLRRDGGYFVSDYVHTNTAPPEAQRRLGRDPREPNLADMGSWRMPGSLVIWYDRYRHQGEFLRQNSTIVVRHVWHHSRIVYVHPALPVLVLAGLMLSSLLLRPVRDAVGWWGRAARRALAKVTGRQRADSRRRGFDVAPM